jgi:hypothetical protein
MNPLIRGILKNCGGYMVSVRPNNRIHLKHPLSKKRLSNSHENLSYDTRKLVSYTDDTIYMNIKRVHYKKK